MYTIHEAVPDDVKGMLTVRHITWIATYPNTEYGITREDVVAKISQKDIGAVDAWKRQILEDAESKTWVAKDANEIVGFIGAQKQPDRNHITGLYIDPDFQGNGIGRALMNTALHWLGSDMDIVLEVVTYNTRAIQFYISFGFVEGMSVTNECGHLPSGKYMPEIEMILEKTSSPFSLRVKHDMRPV